MKYYKKILDILNFNKYKVVYLSLLSIVFGMILYKYLFSFESFANRDVIDKLSNEEKIKLKEIQISAMALGNKMLEASKKSSLAPQVKESITHIMNESRSEINDLLKDIFAFGPDIIPIIFDSFISPIYVEFKDVVNDAILNDIRNSNSKLSNEINKKIKTQLDKSETNKISNKEEYNKKIDKAIESLQNARKK